jgi:ankyrin repeat protein
MSDNDDSLTPAVSSTTSTVSSIVSVSSTTSLFNVSESVVPPIIAAAERGLVDDMRALLDAGADIDAIKHDTLQTACHVAIVGGHEAALALLIERGANLSQLDADHNSPFACAVMLPTDQLAIMLLDAGASLDGLSPNALVLAAAKSVALLTRLLARNVNVGTLRDTYGRNACHIAIVRARSSAHAEVVMRMLVETAGADINAINAAGYTPLHVVAMQGGTSALRLVIELGADVNARTRNDWTALHFLCRKTVMSSLTLLVAAGADCRLVNKKGQLACHRAAMFSSEGALCVLLAAGADFDQRDSEGRTTRQIATENYCALPSTNEVASARRRIAAARLDFVRHRALEVCIGLQPLNLDALQLCEVLMFSCGPLARCVAFHQWWAIATFVKHFTRSRRAKANEQEQQQDDV